MLAYQIIRHNGLSFCAFRAQYQLRKKYGLLKRKFPSQLWKQTTLADWLRPQLAHQPQAFLQAHKANGRCFFFDSTNIPGLNKSYKEKILSQADQILQNRFQYFFDKYYDLGPGPDWFLNPATGKRANPDRHWCDINLFDSAVGDVKFIWEPSRFAWAYTLVRAFAATEDDKYVQKFWSLFESWLNANQPNMGPNYACGQECAIRLMAMCFAFYAFPDAPSTTPNRLAQLVTAVAVHADRIEKNIDFAISTRTNHSLTEAAGLYTAGLLFPEFKRSDHWLKLGKKVLTNEGLKQIYPDGSYTQHSMNYHRLMLQDFLWVMRLAELNGDSFCEKIVSRVTKAAEFLYQNQDTFTGRVPNYGNNDGALIVPLSTCDYLDYRPVIQTCWYLSKGQKLYEPGPWDEDLLWFFGPNALTAPRQTPKPKSMAYKSGGYYTLRNSDSWAMLRCHSYKDRPIHADMLHLDLWWKGLNILRDSGTYMYNCDEPWQSYFGSTAAHNTIVVDHANQMQKALRFMWFNWTKSKFIMHKNYAPGEGQIFQGEHYGYCRASERIVHRRSVLSLKDICWLIVDDILGTATHTLGLCWQICDFDYELTDNMLISKTQAGLVCLAVLDSAGKGNCECFNGNDTPIGWQSLHYGNRKPAPTLVYSRKAKLPVRFVTLISLGDTINNALLSEADMVSWLLDVSGRKYTVALRSIDNSNKNTFVFAQQDAEKVFLH